MTNQPAERDANEVFLRGRLAADPVLRTLPSGDELCSFRLTVARPEGERPKVDSIDCATTTARVRRSLERAQPGDECEVTGSLRRRFWRSPQGLGSRYEVQVVALRISARPRTGASPCRKQASA
jgi:single-strand DNA-binding protein